MRNYLHMLKKLSSATPYICVLFAISCTNNEPNEVVVIGGTEMTAGTTVSAGTMAGTSMVAGTSMPGTCLDRDRDGFQDRSCNPNVNAGGGDCDDTSNAINPGRVENCANQLDNNCNGLLPAQDPMCQQACADADGDGYQDAMCNSNSNNRGGDCNDMNPNVYPGAMEICGNQEDDDCSGGDLPCLPNCSDLDQDGFGNGADCRGLDCDDRNARINPYQSEICGDGIDQDCNGRDLVCPTTDCQDRDRDGFGVGAGCLGIDCNDSDPNVNAGAVEIINDRIDQDCDGRDLTSLNLCDDPDQDGYGTGTGCYGLDCDESDPRIHSGRTEICGNGRDDDCLRGDQVCTTIGTGTCIDQDNDGHGEGACRSGSFDCNDNNPQVNPFAEEVCNNIDDDCDGQVDECNGRNQVCGTDGQCVGRIGSPCSADADCLGEQGLICDPRSRECRVDVGSDCSMNSDCVSTAECTEIGCNDGTRCYQLEGAYCEAACDCTGTLQCNDQNNVCVECNSDQACSVGSICSDGGFCMEERSIGNAGENTVLEFLEVLVDCHRQYRGSPSTRGCARISVGRDLGTWDGGMNLNFLPTANEVDNYVCRNDGEVETHFSNATYPSDTYDRLKNIFGCGPFDIWNIWWVSTIQADTEVCVYYAPNKSGFNFPSSRSEVVVVDSCILSIIE